MNDSIEQQACQPIPISASGINPAAAIPYGCTIYRDID
jgi:hypothetical protein